MDAEKHPTRELGDFFGYSVRGQRLRTLWSNRINSITESEYGLLDVLVGQGGQQQR
ncbi:hypothetical protein RHECNPAF_1580013 [Rhizobium etli CNPAF512]|nr:hypothetical protein RHECNPAF_1580013 [Rhizobium etli CNPAF512]